VTHDPFSATTDPARDTVIGTVANTVPLDIRPHSDAGR